MEYRPSGDLEREVVAYTDRADTARALGDVAAAERLLLLAWAAYDDVDLKLDEEDGHLHEVQPAP